MVKEFNNLKEMQKYYNEESSTYIFKEDNEYLDLIIFNFSLDIKCNIKCRNIAGIDITACDINAYNINAYNINARDINVYNINYFAVCFTYKNIKYLGRKKPDGSIDSSRDADVMIDYMFYTIQGTYKED